MNQKSAKLVLSLVILLSAIGAPAMPRGGPTFGALSLLSVISAAFFPAVEADHSGMYLNDDVLGMEFEALPCNNGGWNDKKRRAAKYCSAGSNYRTWKPDRSDNLDGTFLITTKIDHIRGSAKDDHCNLIMTLKKDSHGRPSVLKTHVEFQIQGHETFVRDFVLAATEGTGYKSFGIIAARIAEVLAKKIEEWGEHGGRANFPNIVEHNINYVAHSVKAK